MPRSINLLNLLTVFARIAGPLSQNNPGATTEGATARMIDHLKHCQTPSKIINGLNLLRASKSPAEHVGRLDMARLHIRNTPFTGSAELVILSQSNRCLCGQLRSYISQEFANFKSQYNRDVEPVPVGNLLASCVLFSVLKTLRQPL